MIFKGKRALNLLLKINVADEHEEMCKMTNNLKKMKRPEFSAMLLMHL